MVLAYHCIFTAYCFWLPNDPRGSWSDFVWAWDLLKFGASTRTDSRRSVANHAHDRDLRVAAKAALKYPPVEFKGMRARAIARGIATACRESDYRILACSIMPDHIHIVPERHERPVEQMIGHMKARATQQLVSEGLHPFIHLKDDGRYPSVWAHGAWKIFLDSEEWIDRAIQYTNGNPARQGMKPQDWRFIKPRHT